MRVGWLPETARFNAFVSLWTLSRQQRLSPLPVHLFLQPPIFGELKMKKITTVLSASILALIVGKAFAAANDAVPEHQTQAFQNDLALGGASRRSSSAPKTLAPF